MGKIEFAAVTLNPEYKTYVVFVASVSSIVSSSSTPLELNVHPSRMPQISALIAEEAPMKFFNKYVEFANVFSPDLVSELSKHTGINGYTIKLVNGQ